MLAKLSTPSAEGAVQKVRFGNFEIMNDPEGRPLSLGKGTFGRTYQARHCYLDTIVALKIITERYAADAAVRQRFLIEARAVAKLSHPHIARLYDFGEMDGVLHYAMEYCGGGSLADHVAKHGSFGLRQVLEVAQQITGALKCAHAAGFIHRDLKPSNIMVTADKDPLFAKLIDFGLVQPSVPSATRSFSDEQSADGARFLGTPLFASPEQLREEPMDVRTDLFSLGMTLWYLLLGGPPESGSSAAIAASRLSAESYTARLPANLPPQVRDVLSKLLEKERNKRFGSAAEVFTALNLCAATLGFRRARDYTDPRAELAEWEDEQLAEQGTSQTAEPEPAEVQKVDTKLSSEFRIVSRINEDFTGLNYVATRNSEPDGSVILHVLHPMLLQDAAAFNRLRVHVAQLMALEMAEILRPEGIKAYSDYVSIVLEKPSGSDLMSILRTEGTVHLVEAASLLESIADACDALCAAGLAGAQLAPGRVFVEWESGAGPDNTGGGSQLSKARPKLYPRFLAVSEAPELARLNEPEDVSSTMTTDMLSDPSRADNMPEHFGTLLYRVVAGRNCPMAAALSSQAYVAIPGLSEHSNRLLSLVIAKQTANMSCGHVLREILSAEGLVPRVPGHPSAGFTARPGSTATPIAGTPPLTPRPMPFARPRSTPAPDKYATPTPPWRAPTVTPPPSATPVVARQPPVAPSVPPVVASEPIAEPVVAAKGRDDSASKSETASVPPAATKPPTTVARTTPVEMPEAVKAPPVVPEKEVAPEPPIRVEAPAAPAPAKIGPQKAVSKGAEKVSKKEASRASKLVDLPGDSPTAVQPPKPTLSVFEPAGTSEKTATPPLPAPIPAPLSVLPKPPIARAPRKPFRPELLWEDPKLRAVGIGLAAMVLLTVSYGAIRKFSNRPAPAKISTAVVPKPSVAPVPPPAASQPPSPRLIAGRYVGQVRSQSAAGTTAQELTRELSIDGGFSSGALIEYGADPKMRVPLSQGHVNQQGVFTARALFSAATGGTHNDENVTVNPGKESGVEVSFQGQQNTGEEYTLSGTFHPWENADQEHYSKLLAERDAAAKKAADEANLAAQQQAAAKTKLEQGATNEQSQGNEQQAAADRTATRRRQSTGGEAAKSAGTTARQAAAAQRSAPQPPPAAPRKSAPREAAAPKPKSEPARRPAFEGGVPGG